jgi:hypothetical protein
MILVVEAIGSLSEASSPARYSPLLTSVSTHARAAGSAQAQGATTHCRTRASATASFAVFEVWITGQ